MNHTYTTSGTCATQISFEIDDEGKIKNVHFTGGCNGNLKAVARLVEGTPAAEVSEKLAGITCGKRATSCADQLAKAIEKAYKDAQQH